MASLTDRPAVKLGHMILLSLCIPACTGLPGVFLDRQAASGVLLHQRSRRANFMLEELRLGDLERECLEEVCSYEEASEIFSIPEQLNQFWTTYSEADQCQSGPCVNGATCVDQMNNYICICPPGFEGRDCDKVQGSSYGCLYRNGGCEHFCTEFPNLTHSCDCAPGYSLDPDNSSCQAQGPLAGANMAETNQTEANQTGANKTGANQTGANKTGTTRLGLIRLGLIRLGLLRLRLTGLRLLRGLRTATAKKTTIGTRSGTGLESGTGSGSEDPRNSNTKVCGSTGTGTCGNAATRESRSSGETSGETCSSGPGDRCSSAAGDSAAHDSPKKLGKRNPRVKGRGDTEDLLEGLLFMPLHNSNLLWMWQ